MGYINNYRSSTKKNVPSDFSSFSHRVGGHWPLLLRSYRAPPRRRGWRGWRWEPSTATVGETEEGVFGDGDFGGFWGFLDTRTSGFEQRGEEDFGNFGGFLRSLDDFGWFRVFGYETIRVLTPESRGFKQQIGQGLPATKVWFPNECGLFPFLWWIPFKWEIHNHWNFLPEIKDSTTLC